MTAAGAVIDEDDFEPTLEENPTDDLGPAQRRRTEARRGRWASTTGHAHEGSGTHYS